MHAVLQTFYVRYKTQMQQHYSCKYYKYRYYKSQEMLTFTSKTILCVTEIQPQTSHTLFTAALTHHMLVRLQLHHTNAV